MKFGGLKLRFLMFSALAAVGAIAILASFGSAPPHSPLPSPNGYDDFLKAASLLAGDPGYYETSTPDELRALFSTNAESLRILRLGLSRRCSVPTEEVITNYAVRILDLPKLKSLRHLIAAEARLAEIENRPAEAASSYIDLIHMGNEIARGGLMLNQTFSFSFGVIGNNGLVRTLPKLGCEQTRGFVAELQNVDRNRVAWNEAVGTENRFLRYQFRKNLNPLPPIIGWWQLRNAEKVWLRNRNNMIARSRLIMTEFALRCYRSEQGRPPATLAQLIPHGLERIPLDPFSGRSLVYQQRGTNWLLYSVGVDGVDDGGKPVGRSISGTVTKGDLFFDSPK